MEKKREKCGDRMNGGTHITPGREKEGEMVEKEKKNMGKKMLLLVLLLRDVR